MISIVDSAREWCVARTKPTRRVRNWLRTKWLAARGGIQGLWNSTETVFFFQPIGCIESFDVSRGRCRLVLSTCPVCRHPDSSNFVNFVFSSFLLGATAGGEFLFCLNVIQNLPRGGVRDMDLFLSAKRARHGSFGSGGRILYSGVSSWLWAQQRSLFSMVIVVGKACHAGRAKS